MTSVLRLTTTAMAVLSALALTACGGNDSFVDGATNTNSLFVPAPPPPPSSTETAAPPKPNSDSDQFTTFAPVSSWDSPTQPENLPKEYYSSKTRGSLHDDVEKAYGQRFDTTFRYTAKITDGTTPIKNRVYRNNEALPLEQLGNGHKVYTMEETMETHIDGVKYTGDRKSRIQLYQQPNSVVLGRQTLSGNISDGKTPKQLAETPLRIDQIKGTPFKKPSASDVQSAADALAAAQTARVAAQTAYNEGVQANKAASASLATSFGTGAGTGTTPASTTPPVDLAPLKKAIDDATIAFNLAQSEYNKLSRQYGIFAQGLEFNYAGEAFNQASTNAQKGKLEYAINFNTLTGHGKITGLNTGTINLNNADMGVVTHTNPDEGISRGGEAVPTTTNMLGIQGVANFADGRKDGKYTLGIFGEYAEEIAGVVTEDNVNTVGFGGVKK